MKFIIKQTIGAEVIMDGPTRASAPVYYGGPPPETGRWHIDLNAFEDLCAARLSKLDFGASIETFYFGLEMAELQQWGDVFASPGRYSSYRSTMKALVSVGQIEWNDVKDISLHEQVAVLWGTLLSSIDRVKTMKRKPKELDAAAFATAVRVLQESCDAASLAIPPV
jgi:hypothetical protein